MSKIVLAVGGVVLVVVLFIAISDGGDGDGDSPDIAEVVVDLEMNLFGPRQGEYGFEPPTFTVTAGQEFIIRLINTGTQAHRFRINNPDGSGIIIQTDIIPVGESVVVSFTLDEPGTVPFFCPIYGPLTMGSELIVVE